MSNHEATLTKFLGEAGANSFRTVSRLFACKLDKVSDAVKTEQAFHTFDMALKDPHQM